MSALIVVESYFGNTRHIASVVADTLRSKGIETVVVVVADAPSQLPDDLELLVVGAPTHDMGLSTPETRSAACARNGEATPAIGTREWVASVDRPSDPPLVALFDTRTGYPWLAGSAAAKASVLLADKGFPVLAARKTFRVRDVTGPLDAGEDEHARHWTQAIAARLEQRRLSHHR
jgi:hypothetical protein